MLTRRDTRMVLQRFLEVGFGRQFEAADTLTSQHRPRRRSIATPLYVG